MKLELRNHQKAAVTKALPVLKREGFFGLLMDMGTGKTITTIDIVERLARDGLVDCFVIVVPAIGTDTWMKEVPKAGDFPTLPLEWDGQKASTQKYQKLFASVLGQFPIYIVNVEAFSSDNRHLREALDRLFQKKVFLTLDESSVIKSSVAIRTKSLIKLAQRAKFRTILTGTEISGHLSDLFTQFEFLSKGFWKRACGITTSFIFQKVFEIVVKGYRNDGATFDDVVKYEDMTDVQKKIYDRNLSEVYRIIDPYVYRIRKEECYDLPPKIYTKIEFDLSKKERTVYDEMKEELMTILDDEVYTSPNQAVAFLRSRMITGGWLSKDAGPVEEVPSKVRALLQHVELHDRQAIIGCSFTHEVDFIAKALSKYGAVSKFYGSNTATRDQDKQDFIEGKTRFFVCNVSAASKSLNLQHCDLVYRFTRTLSPIDESQFEDRVYRDGQTRSPQYIDLVATKSVDTRVANIISGNVNLREKFQGLGKKGFIDAIF